jgi:hypothetical protein
MQVAPAAPAVALATQVQDFCFEETGVVRRVNVSNPAVAPVLVPANLVLRGGRQTRVVERSAVVSAGGRAGIPVKCMERGRWSPATAAGAMRLEGSEYPSVVTRRELATLRYQSHASGGAYQAEQSSVWNHVDHELTRTGVQSPTSSYGAYLSGVRLRHVEEAERTKLSLPVDANAVLLVASEWMAFEAYANASALRERLHTLVADLFEAPAPKPSGRTARQWLSALWEEPLERVASIENTLGEAYTFTSRTLSGEVLLMDGALVHASVVGTW